MIYIDPKPSENGAYPNPKGQPFPGCIPVDDQHIQTIIQYNGFVIVAEDGTVTPNTEAWEAWKAEQPNPVDGMKNSKQEENKTALANWLCDHPLTWTDGKQYGVEEQDQNEMALNLMQYQAAKTAGKSAPLEWHAQKEKCREFTEEEYLGLSMAISAYVYPYRRHQETIKEAIYAAKTVEELEAVVIDYSSVTNV